MDRPVRAEPVDTRTIALGVVCPMANEEARAVEFVEAVLDACHTRSFASVTFFVVLDRVSTDGTRDLLTKLSDRRPEVRVVWAPENRSVVDAYLRGYHEALDAGADWVLEIDAGFSHRPDDMPRFFDEMARGRDCVFGTRLAEGGSFEDSATRRMLISRSGSVLARALLGLHLTDATSGFELFRADVLRTVLGRGVHSRGPFFQTEIKAYCRKLDVAEVPIRYAGASHNVGSAALQDSFRNLWRLFRLRLAGDL
jgi:dolichol-phosphate mannosyltransferase